MELKEFIKTTIAEISEGVAEAHKSISKDSGVLISPQGDKTRHGANKENLEFDIALTTSKEGLISVAAGWMGIGAKTQGEKSEEIVNRIKFSIPIGFQINMHKKTEQK